MLVLLVVELQSMKIPESMFKFSWVDLSARSVISQAEYLQFFYDSACT